jgi:hypothetical protein
VRSKLTLRKSARKKERERENRGRKTYLERKIGGGEKEGEELAAE